MKTLLTYYILDSEFGNHSMGHSQRVMQTAHKPSGVSNNNNSSSSGSGRGFPFTGFGRGQNRNQGSSGRGQAFNRNSNTSGNNNNGVPAAAQPPPPETLPRPGQFANDTPSFDDLQANPEAARLLQEAMAAFRIGQERSNRRTVTVSKEHYI